MSSATMKAAIAGAASGIAALCWAGTALASHAGPRYQRGHCWPFHPTDNGCAGLRDVRARGRRRADRGDAAALSGSEPQRCQ